MPSSSTSGTESAWELVSSCFPRPGIGTRICRQPSFGKDRREKGTAPESGQPGFEAAPIFCLFPRLISLSPRPLAGAEPHPRFGTAHAIQRT
jgi:hypothetical protein